MFLKTASQLIKYLKLEEVSPEDIKIGDIIFHPMQGVALVEKITIHNYPELNTDKSRICYEFANDPSGEFDYRHVFIIRADKKVSMIPRPYLKD